MNRIESRSRRFLFIATADARGHLMRTQLLYHALQKEGAEVQVLTTSDSGAEFLAGFGIQAPVLSRHYAVVFDEQQNMLPGATDRRIATYILFPWHMLRDICKLSALCRDVDIVINDSFHPALLVMGMLPPWRQKVVHVFGGSLRQALENNFTGRTFKPLARLFAAGIARMINTARARIEHDFSIVDGDKIPGDTYRLPTPVALPELTSPEQPGVDIAVYLNPHFKNEQLAQALEAGLQVSGYTAHCVGEGYGDRPGWLKQDTHWISRAASSRMIMTAPGMAGLSVALLFAKPLLLIVTQQPEQLRNARRVAELGLCHRVLLWRDDPAAFSRELQQAVAELGTQPGGDHESGYRKAEERLRAWVNALWELAATHRP